MPATTGQRVRAALAATRGEGVCMLLVRWIGLRHKNKNIVTNDLISDILTCLARVKGDWEPSQTSSQGGSPGKENEPQTKNIHFMQTNAKWLSTEQDWVNINWDTVSAGKQAQSEFCWIVLPAQKRRYSRGGPQSGDWQEPQVTDLNEQHRRKCFFKGGWDPMYSLSIGSNYLYYAIS